MKSLRIKSTYADWSFRLLTDQSGHYVGDNQSNVLTTPEQCRKLARWLDRAAQAMEHGKKGV